jgi:hypothetical protein
MHEQRTSPADRLREALGWRPVPRPDRPVLLVNPRSGGEAAVRLCRQRESR